MLFIAFNNNYNNTFQKNLNSCAFHKKTLDKL